jgi:hypothetical protein
LWLALRLDAVFIGLYFAYAVGGKFRIRLLPHRRRVVPTPVGLHAADYEQDKVQANGNPHHDSNNGFAGSPALLVVAEVVDPTLAPHVVAHTLVVEPGASPLVAIGLETLGVSRNRRETVETVDGVEGQDAGCDESEPQDEIHSDSDTWVNRLLVRGEFRHQYGVKAEQERSHEL